MTDPLPLTYGVWLPGKGWIRGEGNRALIFAHKAVAQEAADRIGNAKVYFIDQSLIDIEKTFLDAEVKVYGFSLAEWFRALKR